MEPSEHEQCDQAPSKALGRVSVELVVQVCDVGVERVDRRHGGGVPSFPCSVEGPITLAPLLNLKLRRQERRAVSAEFLVLRQLAADEAAVAERALVLTSTSKQPSKQATQAAPCKESKRLAR